MILLSFNIRGVGGPLKQASMRRLLEKTHPSIIFLQETLVVASVARDFMHKLRPSWLACAASSVGKSGGLLALWDPTLLTFHQCSVQGEFYFPGSASNSIDLSICSTYMALVLTVKISGSDLMILAYWQQRISYSLEILI